MPVEPTLSPKQAIAYFNSIREASGWKITSICQSDVEQFLTQGLSNNIDKTNDELRDDIDEILRLMIEEAENLKREDLGESTFQKIFFSFCPRPPWCR